MNDYNLKQNGKELTLFLTLLYGAYYSILSNRKHPPPLHSIPTSLGTKSLAVAAVAYS